MGAALLFAKSVSSHLCIQTWVLIGGRDKEFVLTTNDFSLQG
jgi:hypothetical protein